MGDGQQRPADPHRRPLRDGEEVVAESRGAFLHVPLDHFLASLRAALRRGLAPTLYRERGLDSMEPCAEVICGRSAARATTGSRTVVVTGRLARGHRGRRRVRRLRLPRPPGLGSERGALARRVGSRAGAPDLRPGLDSAAWGRSRPSEGDEGIAAARETGARADCRAIPVPGRRRTSAGGIGRQRGLEAATPLLGPAKVRRRLAVSPTMRPYPFWGGQLRHEGRVMQSARGPVDRPANALGRDGQGAPRKIGSRRTAVTGPGGIRRRSSTRCDRTGNHIQAAQPVRTC